MSHFGRAGPPDIRDTYSLLVLNITFRTSADDLYPLFDRYGKVVDIFIPRDRRTGESRGFAFVRYKHAEEAQKAIERLDGRNVDGRDMVVQYAKYGRDSESIHRGKITQGSPKYASRSRSRSPRRPKSPGRGGGKRNFGPPSHAQASPPRGRDGRDRYQGPPPGGRHRDGRDGRDGRNEYRERDREREREHRPRSRSRDRHERDRHRERERDHPRRRSPSRSPSRSRSRSRVRVHDEERRRSQSKVGGRKASLPPRSGSPGRSPSRSMSRSPPPRVSAEPLKEASRNGNDSPHERKRTDSVSPKQQSISPQRGLSPPARRSPSPVERDSVSPPKRVRSESMERTSASPMQRRSPSASSPPMPSSSLTPEPHSPFAED